MNLESMYQEIILDHYRHPLGKQAIADYDVEVHHVNTSCGDEISLRLKLLNGRVVGLSHESTGCSISQASASVLWDLLHEASVSDCYSKIDEFLELMQSQGKQEPNEDSLGDASAFVGVSQFPARVKCALLPWMAMKDALTREEMAHE